MRPSVEYEETGRPAYLIVLSRPPRAYGPYETVRAADEAGWASGANYTVATAPDELGLTFSELLELRESLGVVRAQRTLTLEEARLLTFSAIREHVQETIMSEATATTTRTKRSTSQKKRAKKKAPAKAKAAAKKTGDFVEVPVPRDLPKPKDGESSGEYLRRMIKKQKWTDEQLASAVRKHYEGRATLPKDVAWNRSKLRRDEGLELVKIS